VAFVWDLDGTLLDSYEVIVSSLYRTYRELGVELKKEEILKEVITYSVSAFISNMEVQLGIPFDAMKTRYSEISNEERLKIKPIPNAAEILEYLKQNGARHFVFTHRGNSTEEVLKKLKLYEFFDEIITGKDGFARKPDPSAIHYLVEKYKLNGEKTFYVGDRTIDMECANNAGIRGIMYLPEKSLAKPNGKETYVVKNLLEIRELVIE
jgi:HAD superfamily hydrolase (TIGR01549 family)